MRHTQDRLTCTTRPVVPSSPPPRTSLDELDVDIDVDVDVDLDIQNDNSDDAVRAEERSWSSIPRIVSAQKCPVRDRRRAYRHEVRLPIELTLAGAHHATHTRVLSLGGAFIESSLRPAFASRVELHFSVPGFAPRLSVGGVVRWSDARGFGVQFDGLRAQAVWAMGKYFASLRRAG